MFPIPLFPQTLENTAISSVFFNFSMFQCCWPTQTYIQEILPKHCLSQCFYNISRQKHGHVFRHQVGAKHSFLHSFQCSGIEKTFQNIGIYTVFSFLAVFPLLEAYQNDLKFRFNTFFSSDTQKSSKKIANTS